MVETDPQATYHRTLDMSLAQVPYTHYQARTAVFRKHGVRTAITYRNGAFVPIMYRQPEDRDFKRYATTWETLNSKVPFGDGSGIALPVVDASGLVVGHRGRFRWDRIVVAPGQQSVAPPQRKDALEFLVARQAEVFADDTGFSSRTQGFDPLAYAVPQTIYDLVTDIEGRVVLVLGWKNVDGAIPSAMSPLDLIIVPKLVATLGAMAFGKLISTVARRLLQSRAAREAARELATQMASRLATRPVGRISAEEMERYLRDILANRPELRRLMAARVMTGEGRMQAIKIALQEWERTQGWKVVEKSAAEMRAVTTPTNLATLRPDTRQLWVNKDLADRWDPQMYYETISHELSAHALAGRGGTFTERDLPFVGAQFSRGITDALSILEQSIAHHGGVEWITRTFGRAATR